MTSVADQLLKQGISQYQTSQFEAALESWQQALSLYREGQNLRREGAALGNLGAAYQALGDLPRAIANFKQHLAIAQQIQDRIGEGNALLNLQMPIIRWVMIKQLSASNSVWLYSRQWRRKC